MEKSETRPMILFLKDGLDHKKVTLVDVYFIRAARDYCLVYTRNGEHLSSMGISEMECNLDPFLFYRVHRSYIVNIDQVISLIKKNGKILLRLKNGNDIPVGPSYLTVIRKLIA